MQVLCALIHLISLFSQYLFSKGQDSIINSAAITINNSNCIFLIDVLSINNNHIFLRAIKIIYSTVQVNNCSFNNGYSKQGGAMYILSSHVTFSSNNIFQKNNANYSGGAIFSNSSTLIFCGDIITYNNETKNFNRCKTYKMEEKLKSYSAMVDQCSTRFIDNSAFETGGAIAAINSSLQLLNNTLLHRNSVYHSGGAIFMISKSKCEFSGEVQFVHNKARYGGAMYINNSTVTIQNNVTFSSNSAVYQGGGVLATFRSALKFSTYVIFYNNSAGVLNGGGGYIHNSDMIMTGLVNFTDNTAKKGGGLALSKRSTVELISPLILVFYKNEANEQGGAIFATTFNRYYQDYNFRCFYNIKYITSIDIKITFIANLAKYAGSALFSGNLDVCKVHVND